MNSTIDHLLTQVQVLNRIKSSGLLGGQLLTQSGLDMCNEELSTIEAELDTRKPEGDFVTLLGDDGLPVGFEPVIYIRADEAIEELSGFDQWNDYGFTVGSFL